MKPDEKKPVRTTQISGKFSWSRLEWGYLPEVIGQVILVAFELFSHL